MLSLAACLQADLGQGLPPSPTALWCSKEDLSLSTLNQKNQREKSQTLKTGVKSSPGHLWSAIPQLVIWLGAVNQNSETVLPRGDSYSREETPQSNK